MTPARTWWGNITETERTRWREHVIQRILAPVQLERISDDNPWPDWAEATAVSVAWRDHVNRHGWKGANR